MLEEIRRKSSAAFPSVIHTKEATEVVWFSTMVLWGVFLFAASLGFYAAMQYWYIPKITEDTTSIISDVKKLSDEIDKDKRDQVLRTYSQVLNIKKLLGNHVYASKLFTWLEKNTHKGVFIDTITISIPRDTLDILGKAQDKDSVAEQVSVFESLPEVKSVKLSEVQLQTSPAGFHILITLKPGLTSTLE
ncbi:MAG: hypothetical protein HZA35_04235 [Parcubacteria group bacterium]|nr:hypothetical protein [Parcubacteria group bacterium]